MQGMIWLDLVGPWPADCPPVAALSSRTHRLAIPYQAPLSVQTYPFAIQLKLKSRRRPVVRCPAVREIQTAKIVPRRRRTECSIIQIQSEGIWP
jgi:hypothetical protein